MGSQSSYVPVSCMHCAMQQRSPTGMQYSVHHASVYARAPALRMRLRTLWLVAAGETTWTTWPSLPRSTPATNAVGGVGGDKRMFAAAAEDMSPPAEVGEGRRPGSTRGGGRDSCVPGHHDPCGTHACGPAPSAEFGRASNPIPYIPYTLVPN